MLVALLLLIVSLRCLDNKKDGSLIILGFAGAFSLWLSHPSLFILVGTGFALGLGFLRERDWPQLWRIIGVVLIWCLSFTILYFISLRHPLSDNNVINYWQDYLCHGLNGEIWVGITGRGSISEEPRKAAPYNPYPGDHCVGLDFIIIQEMAVSNDFRGVFFNCFDCICFQRLPLWRSPDAI